MKTEHRIVYSDARNMDALPAGSVDLVVTSPPYPMIAMWDENFARQSPRVRQALSENNGREAFEKMHRVLDPVWREVFRVLKTGGFACINIGDATRTLGGGFALYPNHVRILKSALDTGFSALPCIIWRKQTNAPNKFMGSGVLPAGAYVTLEHEYIIILRKGSKREFKREAHKKIRRESAIFWEERNVWFSDVWFDIKGASQVLKTDRARNRSAAFPFELAYRLINMYSVKGDVVLDPFLGTGTSTAAAIAAARNSIGYEIDPSMEDSLLAVVDRVVDFSNACIRNRLSRHLRFVARCLKENKTLRHVNKHYGFPVMTSQEKELILNDLTGIEQTGGHVFEVGYRAGPQKEFCNNRPRGL